MRQVSTAVERTLDNSRIVTALRTPFRKGLRPVSSAQRFGDVVRDSTLFRWLTAEPDPNVIVIGTWDELKASKAGQLTAGLFVPPEPSEDEN